MITSFSRETIADLGYYVYRLVDPRNGSTFYVGKGRGNRVFAHVQAALDGYQGESYREKGESDVGLKIQRIRDIHNAGLEVIHIIQRWGMTEREAFLVEATLIDVFGLDHLTNIVEGHDMDHGANNAETLEHDLSRTPYEDSQENPEYIIIKTHRWRIDEVEGETFQGRLYEATRCWWKMNISRVKKYRYVLSSVDGIIREVYEVEEWIDQPGGSRHGFIGHAAPEAVRSLFLDHKIPEKYVKKGAANPVLFSKL